jgi:hypothetical protein
MFLERNPKPTAPNQTSTKQIGVNAPMAPTKSIKKNSQSVDPKEPRSQAPWSLKAELEHVDTFGKKGQALIGGYDFTSLKKVTHHTALENLKDFQDSKPSVNKESIQIYSYRTHLKGPLSKYECVWYKFKSPEVIDRILSIPKTGSPVDPKKVLELTFHEARKWVPSKSAILDAKGYRFTFDSQDMRTGFNWIASQISLEFKKDKNIYIKTPILITNRHVPIFGGMSYCKVFTPVDAARIISDLADGHLAPPPIVPKAIPSMRRWNQKHHPMVLRVRETI